MFDGSAHSNSTFIRTRAPLPASSEDFEVAPRATPRRASPPTHVLLSSVGAFDLCRRPLSRKNHSRVRCPCWSVRGPRCHNTYTHIHTLTNTHSDTHTHTHTHSHTGLSTTNYARPTRLINNSGVTRKCDFSQSQNALYFSIAQTNTFVIIKVE